MYYLLEVYSQCSHLLAPPGTTIDAITRTPTNDTPMERSSKLVQVPTVRQSGKLTVEWPDGEKETVTLVGL